MKNRIRNILLEIYSAEWDFNEFKLIKDIPDMIHYCDMTLQYISEGSCRKVYRIDQDFVLKVATKISGISQNNSEVEISYNSKFKNVVAKVRNHDNKFRWIVMEHVVPITEQEFKKYFSVSFNDWYQFIFYLNREKYPSFENSDWVPDLYSKYKKGVLKNSNLNELIDVWLNAHLSETFETNDLNNIRNFGRTEDGRIVVCDYGMNKGTYNKHYRKDAE